MGDDKEKKKGIFGVFRRLPYRAVFLIVSSAFDKPGRPKVQNDGLVLLDPAQLASADESNPFTISHMDKVISFKPIGGAK